MIAAAPVVSVCIANYNGMDIIDACIASVTAQDCDFAAEIIVHDDASTDGSAQYIRERYPDVILIESKENVGFCVANNRMAETARGEYLLLLNNDAELFPDALRTLQQVAERLGRPAILSLPQYDFDSGELIDRGCLLDPFFNPVPNLDPARKDVAMVIGACLWIPKTLWHELGGFPDWFGSIAEDMYLCCRARLSDYPVCVPGISGYRHRSGVSFGGGKVQGGRLSTTFRRRALSERNKSFVMIICSPFIVLLPALPIHLLALIAEGGLLALVRRDAKFWHDIYGACFCSIWRERWCLLSSRSSVQAGRRIRIIPWLAPFTAFPHKLRLLVRHGFPEVRL